MISIVIRCCNEEEHIGRLLTGILQQSNREVEILLVDSGSTDATLAIASRYPVRIESIKPEEFSFGRSLNLGCQLSRGEIIVIASAHVYPVYQDWLARLIAPFGDPQVALAYGRQRGHPSSYASEHQVFAGWFPEASNPNQDHPFCNNANAAIRADVWRRLPYDESLTGLEDVDWARRAKGLGYKIAYVAEAEVVHVHRESPRQICNRYRREAIALRQIYPHERFSFWDFVRLLAANVAADGYQAARAWVFWRTARSILIFRVMQFWGTYRGFQQRGPLSTNLRQTFYYPNHTAHSLATGSSVEPGRRRVEYAGMTEQARHE